MDSKEKGFKIETRQEQREYECEGVVVLTTDFCIPVLSGLPQKTEARLNRYYELMLQEAERYAEKHLHPAASEAFRKALAEGRLIPPLTLRLRYTVTLAESDGALSLYTDMTERAGNDTVVLRRADTFSLPDGYPIAVMDHKSRRKAARRCTRMIREGSVREGSAREGTVKGINGRVGRRLRNDRCCLLPDGIMTFFPPGEIAPVDAGVIELTLPSESGTTHG